MTGAGRFTFRALFTKGQVVAYNIPTVQNFKDNFVRDFPYGTELDTVLDSDIDKAISYAQVGFNDVFFKDQTEFNIGFLLLAAHHLVMNLRASSQGIAGQYSWLQASKGVGSVNESFTIPQKILDNPVLGMLSKTHYGAAYLQIVLPQLAGQIFAVAGATLP